MDRGLTYRELVEFVTDYLEGALPAGERERFEAHMAACTLAQSSGLRDRTPLRESLEHLTTICIDMTGRT